jgi:hypothetical protein
MLKQAIDVLQNLDHHVLVRVIRDPGKPPF